jgi:hypothetical protein
MINSPEIVTFERAYRNLEKQMGLLAKTDKAAFLPNPEPEGPVNYVVICMEPSLGRWASSVKQAKSRVKEGFRNFLPSDETSILHFCIRHYLCRPGERYHITDLSKGAMSVAEAKNGREKRYKKWFELLKKEIDLVATPNARIFAVGNKVSQFLGKQQEFRRPVTEVIHYSGQAGNARNKGIMRKDEKFQAFKNSISHDDLVATAKDVLATAGVPIKIQEETLSRLKNFKLTDSRRKLIFTYKEKFELIRLGD